MIDVTLDRPRAMALDYRSYYVVKSHGTSVGIFCAPIQAVDFGRLHPSRRRRPPHRCLYRLLLITLDLPLHHDAASRIVSDGSGLSIGVSSRQCNSLCAQWYVFYIYSADIESVTDASSSLSCTKCVK